MSQEFETKETGSERCDRENYPDLTSQERKRELKKIQALIDEDRQTPEQKADLFFEQGLLYWFAEEYAGSSGVKVISKPNQKSKLIALLESYQSS